MPKLEEIYARKKEASAQVSTQTRTLAFGFLAIAWALLTAHDDPLRSMVSGVNRYWFLTLAIISVIVLVLDMFQYVAVTRMAESTYRKAESEGNAIALYDQTSGAYRAQAFFYHAKFWVLGLGFLVLIVIFIQLFITPSQLINTAYTLPPELLAKAKTLTRLRAIIAFGGTAWTIFVLLLVLARRWPVYLRDWVERITARRWLQGLIFLPIAILFLVLVPLPFAIYGEHIERAYGISIQPWAGWAGDFGKSAALSIAVFTPLLLLLFWIIRRAPRRWWFWFWMCAVAATVVAVFVAPIWIEPMFNHFSPLEKSDPALVVQLEKLAHHAGLDIPPQRMFLMQASAKTTGYNAYVTGIGASKRIVVWDNTARKLPPDEVLFIVGHEMGHYVLNHIYKGLLFAALSMLGLLWLAYLAAGWLVRRCRGRWGVRALDDWAALAVLALVATVLSFLYMPAANGFSRWEEHQADVFGQEAIHGLVENPQQTAVRTFVALGSTYLEAPDPNRFVEVWLYTHPSISQRADFAADYDPWLAGRHPRYFAK